MRYAVLLSPQAIARVHTVLAENGTIDVLLDTRALLAELVSPRDEGIILDPALLSPSTAETLASSIVEYPRALIAYSSVTTAALESAVILAQRTSARFVFRGTPNERSALEQALLLLPDINLGNELLTLLARNLELLPSGLSRRLTTMFRNGDGPITPDSLAAATAVARRSLDRNLSAAGFTSARRVIEAVRVASAFRAITTSRTPLGHIAMVLGYKSKRTLDTQLKLLLDTTSSKLRSEPLVSSEAARRLMIQLTTREAGKQPHSDQIPRNVSAGKRTLKLVVEDNPNVDARRSASAEK
ncbi:MAG: hypothetical protein ABI035_06995 [Gemmatimonadaceae bacterium]